MSVSTPASSSSSSSIGPLRSRRGCKTCKARRVKCGEEKPKCLRCSSSGRPCEYESAKYGTFSAGTSVDIIDNSLSSSPGRAWRERRAFAYYFQHAAPLIGGMDVDFWSTIIPQVCHVEPAVWDAIISISSLFESYKPFTPTHKYQDALGWYARSVSAVRQRIERGGVDVFIGLISCVLFICIEALQGGTDQALRLYSEGTQLALDLRAQISVGVVPASTASLLEDSIVPIFSRLSIIANQQTKVAVGALLRESDCVLTPSLPSLKAARDAIYVLTAETQQFQEACEKHHDSTNDFHVPPAFISRQLVLLARLENWQEGFKRLTGSLQTKNPSSQQTSIIALLLTHHQMLHVIITTCVCRFKITTDLCLSNFQTIVQQSRISLEASARSDGTQPPFTLDIGVGFPLWFTILRCAESKIRRTALVLLRQSSSVQGFYTQAFGASFGEATMVIEETLAHNLNSRQGTVYTLPSTPDSLGPAQNSPSETATSRATSPLCFVSPDSPTPMSMTTELGLKIPEEARIKPYGAFQSRNGVPLGVNEEDVRRWNASPDQMFLQFSRNRLDPVTGAWRVVDEIYPVGM